ncbi:MAG: hypothetical protein IKZ07_07000 [Akkermansia sp.]|nr:hypothetical protein [Akkermansia sp.]
MKTPRHICLSLLIFTSALFTACQNPEPPRRAISHPTVPADHPNIQPPPTPKAKTQPDNYYYDQIPVSFDML